MWLLLPGDTCNQEDLWHPTPLAQHLRLQSPVKVRHCQNSITQSGTTLHVSTLALLLSTEWAQVNLMSVFTIPYMTDTGLFSGFRSKWISRVQTLPLSKYATSHSESCSLKDPYGPARSCWETQPGSLHRREWASREGVWGWGCYPKTIPDPAHGFAEYFRIFCTTRVVLLLL